MKKAVAILIVCVFTVFIGIIIGSDNVAHASDGDEEQNKEVLNEIIDSLDTTEMDEIIAELNEYGLNLNSKELINSVISGDSIGLEFVFKIILSFFLGDISKYVGAMLLIVCISIITSMLGSLTSDFKSKQVNKIIYIVTYASVITIIVGLMASVIKETAVFIGKITEFNEKVFPLLFTIMSSLGATGAISVYQPTLLFFSEILLKAINYVVMPLFYVNLSLCLVGHLGNDLKISKICSVIKKFSDWLLGIMFGVFATIVTSKGIVGASVDGIALRGIKYTIGGHIPVIGNYLKDGLDIVIASMCVVKNALGYVATIIIIIFTLGPLLKNLTLILVMKMTSALTDSLDGLRISDTLSELAGVLKTFNILIIGTGLCVVLMLSMIILTLFPGAI